MVEDIACQGVKVKKKQESSERMSKIEKSSGWIKL
jgi:hypothetical protein